MVIVRVVWTVGDVERVTLLRDPVTRGEFLCGIECNEYGIAVRTEGCTDDAELMILTTRITEARVVGPREQVEPSEVIETYEEPDAPTLLMWIAAALVVGLLALGVVIVIGVLRA